MQKHILITGVSGFVGTNLVKYLRTMDCYHIVGATRNPDRCSHVKPYVDRIITYEQLFGEEFNYECAVHLAGQVIQKREGKNSEKYFMEANFDLTKRIFDHFLSFGQSKKFIFLSSIHVLTEIPNRVITEDYPPEPFTPYGRSKFEAECYIREQKTDDKQVYIYRPTMIHGEGNQGNLKSLFNYLVKGWPYVLGKVNNKRSFLSIENLCFIIKETIENEITDGYYHLADDEPTHTQDLIEMIFEISGKKSRKINLPMLIIWIAAQLGNILPVPFDMHRYGKLTSDFVVDNQKIKEAIGKPLPVTSQEGIRQTIESFINGTLFNQKESPRFE